MNNCFQLSLISSEMLAVVSKVDYDDVQTAVLFSVAGAIELGEVIAFIDDDSGTVKCTSAAAFYGEEFQKCEQTP